MGSFKNSYLYDTWNGTAYNRGVGFEDALMLLKYRYNGSYNNLAWVQNLYSLPSQQAAFKNNIDACSDWMLMTSPAGIDLSGHPPFTYPWSRRQHQPLFQHAGIV